MKGDKKQKNTIMIKTFAMALLLFCVVFFSVQLTYALTTTREVEFGGTVTYTASSTNTPSIVWIGGNVISMIDSINNNVLWEDEQFPESADEAKAFVESEDFCDVYEEVFGFSFDEIDIDIVLYFVFVAYDEYDWPITIYFNIPWISSTDITAFGYLIYNESLGYFEGNDECNLNGDGTIDVKIYIAGTYFLVPIY